MHRMNEHTQAVLKWREALSVLPDAHFFDLIRMYLGEVKTPYNKQKLIEQLSAFIRKDETKNTLFKLLSETDIMIVTAIMELPFASQDKLNEFFTNHFSFANLFERLMNLEERLIIFRTKDTRSGTCVFRINPYLQNDFENIIDINLLLKSENNYVLISQSVKLTAQLLFAVFTFITNYPTMCKTDGSLKKKTHSLLQEIFPAEIDSKFFQTLLTSFLNIGLLKNYEGELKNNFFRWQSFAQLSEIEQYCYLCAATKFCNYSEMSRRANLVYEILLMMQNKSFEKKILYQAIYLENEKTLYHKNIVGSTRLANYGGGRFASLMQQNMLIQSEAKDETEEVFEIDNSFIATLVNTMTIFGLLQKTRSTIDGTEIYISNCVHLFDKNNQNNVQAKEQKIVSIDAGFNVTIMPGGSLQSLLPLAQCMEIKNVDTVTLCEINRSSCMRAFDENVTPKKIYENLNQVLIHQVPQVLKDSIDEWYKSYNSASIYKGYVLQVSSEKQKIVENNPYIAEHIKKIMAPGIYLMDFETAEDAKEIIEKSTLDFIGQVKTVKTEKAILPFQKMQNTQSKKNTNEKNQTELKKTTSATEEERAKFFSQMRSELAKQNLPQEQAEGLLSRIQRKIILSSTQLRGESVKSERIEASGMDFQGKLHIIEYAITTNNLIELVYDDVTNENGKKSLIGHPIAIEKQIGDIFIKLRVEPSGEMLTLSVGQARLIRRIRGSVFRQ
ncbi:MAG: hypothetical protein GX220_06345 [Treponema sp.]|nr:hypothetical protein [Treponema sp.]